MRIPVMNRQRPARTRWSRLALPGVAALSLLASGFVAASPARAAEITDGLALWYKLDALSGTAAVDSSGNGRDGAVNGTATWTAGQGLTFDGSATYIKVPDNIMGGMSSITVAADVLIDTAQAAPYFIYGFGNSSGSNGNGYLFTTGNSYRTSIATGDWSTEQTTQPASSPNLMRATWKHIAYTQTGTTGVLYEDGVEVARNTAVTITPGAVGGGTTTADYIGRSVYSGDNYFRGKIRDFRVYSRALEGSEVQQLAQPVNTEMVAQDKAALGLGDTSAVIADLALPSAGVNGSAITWASSDTSVVSNTGAITRPPLGQPAAHATLTATLTRGTATDAKAFDVTVPAQFDDQQIATRAAAALSIHNLSDVRGNLALPTAGENGTTVAWSSGDPSVISAAGLVNRPAAGAGAATVTLTATVSRNQATATRDFTATVPALPVRQDYAGYMFSYFTGEGTPNGEQVYFGLSQGNDPLHWQQLNNANPTLTSTLGEKGLRDPFIIRSPEGDKFYQIATDLRIYGNGNWDAAQRTGSKSIMVWESTDLVHWTDQRLVKVSPDTAGNTWAPEAFYDPTLGAYVVFWASKIYADNDPNHTGSTYNKMMYATTRDFYTFSAPQVWKDPGYSVIDSTMTQYNGSYYRFTKDERNPTSSSPCSKYIIEEKSSTILNLNYDFVAECIGSGSLSRGEGPTIFKSNTEHKWYLFIDEYGGRGYVPFETTDLDSGVWTMSTNYTLPASPRHGTVMPVTQTEYDRLLGAYQPDQLVNSVDDTSVLTSVGDAPLLPATVTAHYADGSSRSTAVTWDAVDPSAYASAGSFTVQGTLAAGVTVRARATVTVTAEAIPVSSLTVSPTSLRLGIGVSRAISATVLPANATARALTWTSNDPSVATVSSTGVVTTVAAGTAQITVRTADSAKVVTIPVEATADIPADLLLQYTFDDTSTSVAHDASGRGNDGTYPRTPAFGTGVHGGSFKMSGGSSSSTTAPYVTIPNGVLNGVTSVTVSTWVKWNASSTRNQWLFGLGPDSNKYLFTSPYNGGSVLYSAVTTGSFQAESKMTAGSALTAGVWKHVAVVIDSVAKTAVMYLDGAEAARATNVTIKPSDLYDASKSYSGYIGKSLYSADPYFGGEVDDFRVYGRALPASEILNLAGNTTGIASVSLPELKVPAVVNDTASQIVLPVREGTDLTHLAPQFVTAQGASISPASATARDFTSPVTYTVTGSDGATRVWTVQARVMKSPVLPGLYADPNIVVFGDTFYMYPTTDGFDGWTGTQFHAFSSTDLVHWQDHGVILDLGPDVSWADNSAWAPTIAEKNGKYYFYFSGGMATGNTAKQLGVAVSDSPTGPFKDALGKPLVAAGQFSGQMIDSAVFTDDNGQSYLYWGNGNSYQVPLNADMVSFDPAQVRTYKPAGYNEGSFVIKRNGLYYFMWSENDTRSENYQVAYATSTSPLGPWSARQGVILQKDLSLGIKGTGHHSVVRVPGTDDWYIAYHRFAIPGGDGTHRETTIDRLMFNSDGTIKPVVPTLESVDPIAIVHAGPDASGSEGVAIPLAGTISGTGTPTWTYQAGSNVDARASCAFSDAHAAKTAITCTDDGTYTVTVTAGDSTDSATVTVDNLAPVITGISAPAKPVAVGKAVKLTAPFIDLGANDTQTCSVDWHDGNSSPGLVRGGACTADHTYTKAGIYTATVTVTDDDGGSFTAASASIVVYDPSGFAAGGGWIDSPAGAYLTDRNATGRAWFGFSARYDRGDSVPEGSTEFRFHAGRLNFQSTSYDWLVVSGSQAQYQGSGRINDRGGYRFLVVATDGAVDRFRIKIWNAATGVTVYDNQVSDDATAIRDGGIVIRRNPPLPRWPS
jgi:beta-xylosidase